MIQNKLRKLLPRNAFARSVGVVAGGTAGAQILTVVAAPLLTRLYNPETFGILAVFLSLLTVISLVATLRYELAIPLPEQDEDAANLVALSLLLVGIGTLIVGGVVLLTRHPVSELLGVPELAEYLWLLPLGILVIGAYNTLKHWSLRVKRFKAIASTKLWQALASLALQLGLFKTGGFGLIFGHVTGQGIGTTRLARPNFSAVSRSRIWQAAVRYQRFVKYSLPGGFFRVAGLEIPPLILAGVFSPAAAGLYALTNRVLSLPASFVGGAVSQVFFADASEAYREGTLGKLVKQVHLKMAHVGFPLMLVLILLGPDLFDFAFGADWRQSGEFAKWMAPWLYLVFVSSPLTVITAVMERQKQGFMFHLVLLILRVASLLTGVWLGDLMLTIILLSLVNALWRLVFLIWLCKISGVSVLAYVTDTLSAGAVAILCTIPVFLAVLFANNLWPYALVLTGLLVSYRYWLLLKEAY